MPTGSCFCEKVKIEYSGEPAMTALCHCADCRKISGGNYSNNFIIPSDNFKLSAGTPKEITKTADSGKSITSCFCGDCGTTIFRYGDSFGGRNGNIILKAGVLDDVNILNSTKPGNELYVPERIQWVKSVDGADAHDAMP